MQPPDVQRIEDTRWDALGLDGVIEGMTAGSCMANRQGAPRLKPPGYYECERAPEAPIDTHSSVWLNDLMR